MDPVERYLEDVRLIAFSGAAVPETSYYPPLSELLNAVGRTLAPRVSCIINLANRGAGLPDGGLFTADQLKRRAGDDAFTAQVPSRGAIEVKPPSDAIQHIARSEQVARYLTRYRWRCVPNNVWTYTIGGYQAIKKRLSYRERGLLGRDLSPDEARYVTEMVRRIAAILLLHPQLDASSAAVKAATYARPQRT